MFYIVPTQSPMGPGQTGHYVVNTVPFWMPALFVCYWPLTSDLFTPIGLQARNYINSLPQMPKRNFSDVFIGANPQGNVGIMIKTLKTLGHM